MARPSLVRSKALTLDDFFTGLMAGLASLGVRVVSIRGERFHEAVEEAFHDLEREAEQSGLSLKFTIARNPIHGDFPDVREALVKAVQRDLVSLDNPTYQDIEIRRSAAKTLPTILIACREAPELFIRLAESFLDRYPAYR